MLAQVRRNSCEGLASLALVLTGRTAIAEADGMASLTGALLTTPEAAARALRVSIVFPVCLFQYKQLSCQE